MEGLANDFPGLDCTLRHGAGCLAKGAASFDMLKALRKPAAIN
jgi:hypothetical protein